MNECKQPNYCIENDDWRPTQEILLTRFAQIEYSEMFRTINQDYGSFYYRKPTSPCIPDALKEKLYRRHERFINWLVKQASQRQPQDESGNLFPQCNTQTVTITHWKKFFHNHSTLCRNGNESTLTACNIDELIIDFLLKQIQQRLEGLIDPNDYSDVFKCAKILLIELLNKEPSLCAEDVINLVIAMMNTPFCNTNTDSNINHNSGSLSTVSNQTTMHSYPARSINECYPVTLPSSSLLPFSNPIFIG